MKFSFRLCGCYSALSMVTRQSILRAVFGILALYAPANAQLVFAHFAQGGGYQTTFTLTCDSSVGGRTGVTEPALTAASA